MGLYLVLLPRPLSDTFIVSLILHNLGQFQSFSWKESGLPKWQTKEEQQVHAIARWQVWDKLKKWGESFHWGKTKTSCIMWTKGFLLSSVITFNGLHKQGTTTYSVCLMLSLDQCTDGAYQVFNRVQWRKTLSEICTVRFRFSDLLSQTVTCGKQKKKYIQTGSE